MVKSHDVINILVYFSCLPDLAWNADNRYLCKSFDPNRSIIQYEKTSISIIDYFNNVASVIVLFRIGLCP